MAFGRVVDILRYVIGLDARPFRKEAARVDRDSKKLDKSIRKQASGFGRLAQAVRIAAGSYALLKLGGVIKDATIVAARIEVLNNVFQETGIRAGNTAQELDFARDKLISLGIAELEALQIAQRFIQVNLDLADAIKVARAAQDLAVIANENSSVTALRLTEAIVKQRPILLKQFGIVANLDVIYGKMAETLDKTVDELTTTEKRTAFLNTVLEQSARVAGSYEKAMDDVGKRLTSLPRFFQNAQKAVGQQFLPAMRLAVDGTTALLKSITELFSADIDIIVAQITKLPRSLETLDRANEPIKALREEFVRLSSNTERTTQENERLIQVIARLEEIFPTLALSINATNQEFANTIDVVDALITALDETRDIKIGEIIAGAADEFGEASQRATFLREEIERLERIIRANTTASEEQRDVWAEQAETATEMNEILGKFALASFGIDLDLRRFQLQQLREELGRAEQNNQTGLNKDLERIATALAQVVRFEPSILKKIREENLSLALAIDKVFRAEEALAEQRRRAAEFALLPPFDQPSPPPQPIFGDEAGVADLLEELILNSVEANGKTFEVAARQIAAGIFNPKFFQLELDEVLQQTIRDRTANQFQRRREELVARRDRSAKREEERTKRQIEADKRRQKIIQDYVDDFETLPPLTERWVNALDQVSLALDGIDRQLANIVQSAADFVANISAGNIGGAIASLQAFGQAGANLLFGGDTRREEFERQRRAESDREAAARELIRVEERLTQAVERLTAAFEAQTLAGQAETVSALQETQDLFRELRNTFLRQEGGVLPGDFTIGGVPTRSVEEILSQLNELLQGLGLLDIGEELDFEGITGQFADSFGPQIDLIVQSIRDALTEAFGSAALADLFLAPFGDNVDNQLQAMIDILQDVAATGGDQGDVGLDLLSFWTGFADLDLEQRKKLLETLLAGVQESGDISRQGLLDLLSQLESIDDEIENLAQQEEEAGLTQIQRSVTTITEGQGNIIAGTLNRIAGILGLMDDKLQVQIDQFAEFLANPNIAGPVDALVSLDNSLTTFFDRLAQSIGPLVTVQAGGIVINQQFLNASPETTLKVTAESITEALLEDGRAKGIPR